MEPAKKKPKRNSKHDTEGEEKPPFTCQQRWNLDKLQHCSQLILDPKSSQQINNILKKFLWTPKDKGGYILKETDNPSREPTNCELPP